MAKKSGIWRFLRGLGRRGSSPVKPGFVIIEPSPEPEAETVPSSPCGPPGIVRTSTAGAAGTAEAALSEAMAHCVNTYIRPAVQRLGGDDSLIQHPTSRAVLAAMAGYWLLAVCSSLILLVAALAAPALRSVRALEAGDSEHRRRWLRYWAVYAVVATVSIVSDRLHSLIPGYWTAKTLLLLWCAAPYPWHGSDYVFYNVIVPGWRHLEETIRQHIDVGGSGSSEPPVPVQ